MEYYCCLGMVQIGALTNASFVVEDVHQGAGRSFAALRMTGEARGMIGGHEG